MSHIYPSYELQVYSFSQRLWVRTSHEVSNRPHHYDYLRGEFERLVASAKCEASPNQQPIGYRIISRDRAITGEPVVIDSWDNGKVERPTLYELTQDAVAHTKKYAKRNPKASRHELDLIFYQQITFLKKEHGVR